VIFDPKKPRVRLLGDPKGEGPLLWEHSFSSIREAGGPLQGQIPEMGIPDFGDSLAKWMLEMGPSICLDLHVGAIHRSAQPYKVPRLHSQLTVSALGPDKRTTGLSAFEAAEGVTSWLGLYEEGSDWKPCTPFRRTSGMFTPIQICSRSRQQGDQDQAGCFPHFVGATARFLEHSLWKGLVLGIRVRATPPSEQLQREANDLMRTLKRSRDNTASFFVHHRSKKLLARLHKVMDCPSGNPFQVNLGLYSPTRPAALTRVLSKEAMGNWIHGQCSLERSLKLHPRAACPFSTWKPQSLAFQPTTTLLRWMAGVRTEEHSESEEAEVGNLIPF